MKVANVKPSAKGTNTAAKPSANGSADSHSGSSSGHVSDGDGTSDNGKGNDSADDDAREGDEEGDEDDEEEESDDEPCLVCGSHGTMILCDGENQTCEVAVHLECYKPGAVAPEGDWFCDRCANSAANAGRKEYPRIVCCDDPNKAIRLTTPIPGIPFAFVHVNCAKWNASVGMPRGDDPVKLQPYLLSLTHVCHICDSKTGLRVKCSRQCTKWFHVSCAINEGILSPSKNRSAKHHSNMLVCTSHYHGNGKSNSATSVRQTSSNSERAKVSSTKRGDLKDWENRKMLKTEQQQQQQQDEPKPAAAGDKNKRKAVIDSEDESGVDAAKKQKQGDGLQQRTDAIETKSGSEKSDAKTPVPGLRSSDLGASSSKPPPLAPTPQAKRSGDAQTQGVVSSSSKDPNRRGIVVNESPADMLARALRTQERFVQDVQKVLPLLQKQAALPQRPNSASASSLDSLLDKAHETSEMTSLKREIEALKAKSSLQETTLISLRQNLVTIFDQLKLSTITPDESSVDDYVALLRDLMKG